MNTGDISFMDANNKQRLTLSRNEIHIWATNLKPFYSLMKDYTKILSPLEVERANNFKFVTHRNRYLLSRSILKMILGGYLSMDPGKIAFTTRPDGKLYIPPELNPALIKFNVSHSHDLAVYAIAVEQEIGIDVEYIRAIAGLDSLVNNVLSKHEQKDFRTIPEHDKLETFFKYWAHKEAYLKTTGEGLAHDMRRIEFLQDSYGDLRLVHVDGKDIDPSRWFVSKLMTREEYICALVAVGNDCMVTYFDWETDKKLLFTEGQQELKQ